MPFTFLLFIPRNPALTPTEFKTHWETIHIPLLKSIAGPLFPLTHTRHYISRPAQDPSHPDPKSNSDKDNEAWPAAVLVGTQEDFTYDGIAELVFENEVAFHTFMAKMGEEENAKRISEDEERFIVRERMRAVVKGGTEVTGRG